MKQIGFKIICLLVWACITVFSGFGQEAVNLESRILETFNGNGDSSYTWKAEASRFITKNDEGDFPKLTYVEAWPISAFGNKSPDGQPLRSLGLHGKFDRRGYNWIDLYPVLSDDSDENPFEIPIPGKVHNIDLWVWGANLRFYIEVYVRDYRGVIHCLELGDIAYPGWRNLRVNIPTNIPQARRILPSYAGLTFVKFRIWTRPVERVDNFYVYFKQLKILTDTFDGLFDGSDLADPQNVEQLWANN